MLRFLHIALFVVVMEYTETLLDYGAHNSHTDQIISELKHNMSQLHLLQQQMETTIHGYNHTIRDLEQKLSVSLMLLGKQQRTVTEMNQTIRDQRQTIKDLNKQNLDHNVTITDQRRKLESLEEFHSILIKLRVSNIIGIKF